MFLRCHPAWRKLAHFFAYRHTLTLDHGVSAPSYLLVSFRLALRCPFAAIFHTASHLPAALWISESGYLHIFFSFHH